MCLFTPTDPEKKKVEKSIFLLKMVQKSCIIESQNQRHCPEAPAQCGNRDGMMHMRTRHTETPTEETTEHSKKKQLLWWTIAAAAFIVVVVLIAIFSGTNGGEVHPVYINEILASNTCHPNADGRCCDYIELYNSADYDVDISGFLLGDLEGSGRYQFPSGTVLKAGGYLVVYCDSTAQSDGYAPFNISRGGGETFHLIASNGAIIDKVTTLPTELDQSQIRQADGSWAVSQWVSPGYSNEDGAANVQSGYLAADSSVCISEFSSANNVYAQALGMLCDWIELHNTGASVVDISGYSLSDNVGNEKYRFPQGTVLDAGEYLLVYCAAGAEGEYAAPFGLSKQGGESVVLKDTGGMVVQLVDSLPMDSGSQVLRADGLWELCQFPSPGYENTQQGHEAFLRSIGAAEGTVIISELMAASHVTLPDAYGDFSDWVELYNAGSETVHLDGWSLSDDPSNPAKWQFPALDIQPGQRILIFLSGRDTVVDGQVHTSFSLSASGESLILSSYLGTTVDEVTFGASQTNTSFVCDGAEPVLCDTPTPGYTNDDAGYESFCQTHVPAGALAIWEVMTSNDWYLAQDLGKCYDWVELKNVSNRTIDLSAYSISDDPGSPDMYTLPQKTLGPGETVVIILSGDESLSTASYAHAGFTLDAAGDQLLLFGPDGTLEDYVYLNQIPLKHSYGRSDSAGGFFYMTPTPGAANKSGSRQISDEPTSEIAAGVYTDPTGFTVPLEAKGTIYYTVDGSDPTSASRVYQGPITITESTVLRAVAIENGKLVSPIWSATFLVTDAHSIPVVSLVTDPDNLWGANGIYKDNNIDIKEQKRAANLSYSGADGSFSLDCEISMHGATSLMYAEKKSFTLRFQDNYDGILNYDLFEDGEVTHFSSLILRAARESTFSTHIRDVMMGYVASGCTDSVLSQKYKFVALYLNGEYWGLYALREQHTAEHYGSYMHVPADTVTYMHYPVDTWNSLKELYQFLGSNDLRSEENYAYAKSILDMESFADWIILEAWTGNIDIYGNMRYYYSSADGLWRCGLVDLDLGMFSGQAFDGVTNSFSHGRLVRALLQNEEFQQLVATRLAELLSGPLSDESMQAVVDMMADSIREEMTLETARWGYTMRIWENDVAGLRNYCAGRADTMIESFCEVTGFTEEQKQYYFGDLLNQ